MATGPMQPPDVCERCHAEPVTGAWGYPIEWLGQECFDAALLDLSATRLQREREWKSD